MGKITVLGAGGWGLALALSLNRNFHKVFVWSPFDEEVKGINLTHTNEKLLSGIQIPKEIVVTTDISVLKDCDMAVIATPSFAVADTARLIANENFGGIVVNVAKGFDKETMKRLSQIITEYLPKNQIVVLSGPSHAEEVARQIPTMLTAAGQNHNSLKTVQKYFSNEYLRVYTNPDIIGVELGGALKNIIAVAAGVCDGIGLGDNSKAALITRGLAEMTRLGQALGADATTFAGLTGMGDLIVTCTSKHSRNHRFGELIGRGQKVSDALREVGTVEGYFACGIAAELAKNNNVEAPIIEICYQLLYKNYPVVDIVKTLMTRPFKEE